MKNHTNPKSKNTAPNPNPNLVSEPNRKGLWSAYKSISPRTRILFGTISMVVATAGLYISDYLEEKYPDTGDNSGLGVIVPSSTVEKSL
ncbi:hypothetical protein AYI68_g690 [Smittium mucronatum]|uniref:Uncharacterized protein n=1 Tax=Smittium mucronatum TaxID=133383 RepID=A0A1R0H7K6_9FUNG|nr:hypothetical protein AYI68_g690 [Smittium mucronatum]